MSLSGWRALQVPLAVACLAPFLAAPQIHLGYSVGRHAMGQTLPLPLVVTKFCTPPSMAISREAFFERWRALDGRGSSTKCLCRPCTRESVTAKLAAARMLLQDLCSA